MRQLQRYIRPYWWYIIFTTIIKLAGTVTELMILFIMHYVPTSALVVATPLRLKNIVGNV